MDEVGTFAVGKLRIVRLGRPHAAPHACLVSHQMWREHFLLGSPRAEVAVYIGAPMSYRGPAGAVRTIGEGYATSIDIGEQVAVVGLVSLCKKATQ